MGNSTAFIEAYDYSDRFNSKRRINLFFTGGLTSVLSGRKGLRDQVMAPAELYPITTALVAPVDCNIAPDSHINSPASITSANMEAVSLNVPAIAAPPIPGDIVNFKSTDLVPQHDGEFLR